MKEKLLPGYGNIAESDILKQFRQQRVYIETYGCRYNFGDTAKFIEVLKYIGGTLVKSAEEADAVVINTCTVVGATERRMLRRLSRFRDNNLFVMGCMPAVQRDAIFAVCTPIIISPTAIRDIYRTIRTVPVGGVAIVQVAQGCSGSCTYCLARIARGSLKSIPRDEILAEIAAHAAAGSTEIQITAQDVSIWGNDSARRRRLCSAGIGRKAVKKLIVPKKARSTPLMIWSTLLPANMYSNFFIFPFSRDQIAFLNEWGGLIQLQILKKL